MDRYIFPAVFEPGDKKGYVVTFPDLPDCITEGDTMEEALWWRKSWNGQAEGKNTAVFQRACAQAFFCHAPPGGGDGSTIT